MQKKAKNKQITGDEAKDRERYDSEPENAPQGQPTGKYEEYFFAGGGEYEPCTVKANNPEEAQKIWEKQRKKVEPVQEINE